MKGKLHAIEGSDAHEIRMREYIRVRHTRIEHQMRHGGTLLLLTAVYGMNILSDKPLCYVAQDAEDAQMMYEDMFGKTHKIRFVNPATILEMNASQLAEFDHIYADTFRNIDILQHLEDTVLFGKGVYVTTVDSLDEKFRETVEAPIAS